MEKYVNPNVNTYVVSRAHLKGTAAAYKPTAEILAEWIRRGKHWVDEVPLDFKAKTVDDAYRHFVAEFAVADSKFSGYMVDEFCERPERKEINRINLAALQRIAERPDFAGKKIYPYIVTTCPKLSEYADAWKFAVRNHFLLAQEWYVRDVQPGGDKWDGFDPAWHTANMTRWNSRRPGAESSLIMTLSGWNLPDCSGNLDPRLDCKVSLDRQMHFLANHPAYRHLQGVNVWTSSYMDEELIRWMCRLFRHYCLEGNRDRLSSDPYVLPHLVNPDFEQGTDGWRLRPAGPETIRPGTLKDFGIIQGRYAYRTRKGEHFLIARRSKSGPNVISQTVRHLTPGRLYSFRMYTADYGDLKSGRSQRQKHGVSISLRGAKLIPGRAAASSLSLPGERGISPLQRREKALLVQLSLAAVPRRKRDGRVGRLRLGRPRSSRRRNRTGIGLQFLSGAAVFRVRNPRARRERCHFYGAMDVAQAE